MNAESRYGFINAKLRARIGLMRESRLLDEMKKAASLVDAVAAMRDTGFAPVARVYDETGDLQEMEFVLLKGEIASYQEVSSALGGKPERFVMQLLGKIEEDNLKNAIRLWYSGVIRLHSIRYRSEYIYQRRIVNDIAWQALINSMDWKGVVKSVKGTFYEPILSAWKEEDIAKRGLFPVETAIDKGWYRELMASLELLCREDRKAAETIFLTDFDLKNLLNLIRYGAYHKVDGRQLSATLFPWGRIAGSKEAKSFIECEKEKRDPSAIVKRYYPALADDISRFVSESKEGLHSPDALERETLRLEEYLGKVRAKEYHALLVGNPFSIAIPLAYFYLYRDMDEQIRAILNGKYYGYSDQEIRRVRG